MSQREHTLEQIINKLPFGFAQGGEPAEPREAEVELASLLIAAACAYIAHRGRNCSRTRRIHHLVKAKWEVWDEAITYAI